MGGALVIPSVGLDHPTPCKALTNSLQQPLHGKTSRKSPPLTEEGEEAAGSNDLEGYGNSWTLAQFKILSSCFLLFWRTGTVFPKTSTVVPPSLSRKEVREG